MRCAWLGLVVAACGDAAAPLPDADPALAQTLAETGLCEDARCTRIAGGALAYAPQYALYTNGATKRRWIALPDGAPIDTTDMDHWRFPVGTRLWKEFTRDGVRVETRFLMKLAADDAAPGAWLFATFAWDAAQQVATRAPDAGVRDANGTAHDIPSQSECKGCHENVPGRVLGLGAMSLDYAAADGLDLDALAARGALSTALPAKQGAHYFPVPGTDVDRAAFGYLHANCGGCHNPTSRVHLETPIELRLVTGATTLDQVPARQTTVGVAGRVGGLTGPIVAPGNPADSVMIIRMNAPLAPEKMPALGTELVDPVGQEVLTAWISQPP